MFLFLAFNEEGIYRLSGSSAVIHNLKDRFNHEGDVDLLGSGEFYDVHAIAGLLKLYFRELPVSVLTSEYQRDFLNITGFFLCSFFLFRFCINVFKYINHRFTRQK